LAEYAAGDKIQNLPINYFRILPFNIDHAQRAGEFASIAFDKKCVGREGFEPSKA
jgi:hypothetical protein